MQNNHRQLIQNTIQTTSNQELIDIIAELVEALRLRGEEEETQELPRQREVQRPDILDVQGTRIQIGTPVRALTPTYGKYPIGTVFGFKEQKSNQPGGGLITYVLFRNKDGDHKRYGKNLLVEDF